MDNRPLIGHTKTRLLYTQADARIAHFSYMKDEKSRQFAIWQIARQFVGNYFNVLLLTLEIAYQVLFETTESSIDLFLSDLFAVFSCA